MKTLITTTAFALTALVLAPAAFADTKNILGCDTYVNSTGERNKVNPTCQFAVIGNQHSILTIDPDGVADSGDEFTVADTAKQD
jgi:hypothetical protein